VVYTRPENTRYQQKVKHSRPLIILQYRRRADSQHGDLVFWDIHFIDRQFQGRPAIPRRGRYVNRSVSVRGRHVSFCRVSGTCVKKRRHNDDDWTRMMRSSGNCNIAQKLLSPRSTSMPNCPLLAGKLEMKTARVRILERSFPRGSRKTRDSSLRYVRWNCSRVCIMLVVSRHLSSHAHGAP